ncbi:hypothetical protein pb186bvf_005247 [Paramecium bursaria]
MGCSCLKSKQKYEKKSKKLEAVQPMSQSLKSQVQSEELQQISTPVQNTEIKWAEGEQIGQGAFGRVIIGMNRQTGQVMAVKQVYKGNMREKDEKVISLQREIELLSKLQHPNIVRYYGSENTSDFLNIFLEFVSGGSVQSMLVKFGKFKENMIRIYLTQILNGLDYLHSKGVIHRDIKGANILIDNNGQPKLADFGSSKIMGDLMNETLGSICGTPNYIAPEVIKQQQYGIKADIWSLGCTIIEMATGNPPYKDIKNSLQIMIKIGNATEPPPIPDELKSEDARDFITKCLRINPNERWTVKQLQMHPFIQVKSLGPKSPVKRVYENKAKNFQIQNFNYGRKPSDELKEIDIHFKQQLIQDQTKKKHDFQLDEFEEGMMEPKSPQFEQGQGSQQVTKPIKIKNNKYFKIEVNNEDEQDKFGTCTGGVDSAGLLLKNQFEFKEETKQKKEGVIKSNMVSSVIIRDFSDQVDSDDNIEID